ncbi:hypothetical protein DFH27DRAFT_556298 [Peziza echinospora]|nr:hypothetical protein DFH27DRAFT_556298 [Peziza echinospora]
MGRCLSRVRSIGIRQLLLGYMLVSMCNVKVVICEFIVCTLNVMLGAGEGLGCMWGLGGFYLKCPESRS